MSVPLGERGGTLRGAIDLACARLPGFVFGGRIGSLVPVFHFHDERTDNLGTKVPAICARTGIRLSTRTSCPRRRSRRPIREREVALCFDDAWASVWTDAAPLLRQYGLRAIVYPIPGRVADALTVRADDHPGGSPFMTWPELRALHAEGLIDVRHIPGRTHASSHRRLSSTSSSPATNSGRRSIVRG